MNLTKIKKLSNEITNVDFLLFKIILGDKSDNIPSIKYRLGPKKAMEYVLDKSRSKLKLLLKEDTEIANGFKRNKLLISMNEIPKYISDLIIENFKSLC
jgi:5'-3' exonuclease